MGSTGPSKTDVENTLQSSSVLPQNNSNVSVNVPCTTAQSIGQVSVKLITFCHKNPEMSFLRLESQFELANIRKDSTKYHHVVAALQENIICNISITGGAVYSELIKSVLNSLKENIHLLIEKALSSIDLGDKRPFQLVLEIKRRFLDIGFRPDESIKKSRMLTALPLIYAQRW